MENICPACRANMHEECFVNLQKLIDMEWGSDCCCPPAPDFIDFGEAARDKILEGVSRGGVKEDQSLKDQTSTGRKRAALLYPITDGMLCEWAGLKYAGGGEEPVVGCDGALIYKDKGRGAIHHGPDKSTVNNEEGNVHRICTPCHNRWHNLNDPYYGKRPDGGEPFIPLSGTVRPHDAVTEAEDADYERAEEYWETRDKDRVRMGVTYRADD